MQTIESTISDRRALQLDVSDVPVHTDGAASSSIGGLGRPSPASSERLKGASRSIITSESVFEDALEEFFDGVRRLDGERFTRIQYRAIVAGDLLRQHRENLSNYVESVVPLDSGHLGGDPVFVYLAHNHPVRQSDLNDLERVRENLRQALMEPQRSLSELLQPKQDGYDVSILTEDERRSDTILEQIALLYKRFGWNKEAVGEMLTNPNNTFAVARHDGQVVSAGIAELGIVPVISTEFRIAELTEAATLREHERRGFYTAISTNILLELRRRSRVNDILGGEIDLVFGESNGLSEGVLRVARHQGRRFATETGIDYGFPERGILHQQVRIEGPINSSTPYNDLIVTYLTRSDLYGMR